MGTSVYQQNFHFTSSPIPVPAYTDTNFFISWQSIKPFPHKICREPLRVNIAYGAEEIFFTAHAVSCLARLIAKIPPRPYYNKFSPRQHPFSVLSPGNQCSALPPDRMDSLTETAVQAHRISCRTASTVPMFTMGSYPGQPFRYAMPNKNTAAAMFAEITAMLFQTSMPLPVCANKLPT